MRGITGSEKRMKWQVEEREEVGVIRLCVVGGVLLARKPGAKSHRSLFAPSDRVIVF